jgi:hypothetical protein
MAYNTDEKRREAERQMQEELLGLHEYGNWIIRKQDSYGMFRIEHKEGATPKPLLGLWTDKTEAMAAIDRVTKEPVSE